jgi:hypothetical protein
MNFEPLSSVLRAYFCSAFDTFIYFPKAASAGHTTAYVKIAKLYDIQKTTPNQRYLYMKVSS